jgi:hypothetical protein
MLCTRQEDEGPNVVEFEMTCFMLNVEGIKVE